MAALAVVNSGAGLVTVATDRKIAPLHSHLTEAMAFDLEEQDRLTEQLAKSDVVLIGPGLAENQLGLDILQKVVQTVAEQQILIMDGGAISLFSKGALPFPKAQTVFTPHQKEWEGLSGLSLSIRQRQPIRRRSISYLGQYCCAEKAWDDHLSKWARAGL